jgi:CheY-like chemotaxis protein
LTPARILVVEDEALILMSTLDMLRELGHEPVPARNGETALSRLEEEPSFDVLLTDVNLPDTDGQALALEARRRCPGLPVVFATGYRLSLEPELKEGGPTVVLGKPYMQRELAAALRQMIRGPGPS